MRDVKNKKEIIERKTGEIEVLKRNLGVINTHAISCKTTTEITVTEDKMVHSTGEVSKHSDVKTTPPMSPYTKSKLRPTIVAPKGTKRKG